MEMSDANFVAVVTALGVGAAKKATTSTGTSRRHRPEPGARPRRQRRAEPGRRCAGIRACPRPTPPLTARRFSTRHRAPIGGAHAVARPTRPIVCRRARSGNPEPRPRIVHTPTKTAAESAPTPASAIRTVDTPIPWGYPILLSLRQPIAGAHGPWPERSRGGRRGRR